MAVSRILSQVEGQRLVKATESVINGAYSIRLLARSEEEIRGFVTNGDGKEYGVVLTEAKAFCSCRDAMFRNAVCKHAVILALHTIRNPQTEAETEAKDETPRPFNLKLAKVRPSWMFSACRKGLERVAALPSPKQGSKTNSCLPHPALLANVRPPPLSEARAFENSPKHQKTKYGR